MRKLRSDKAPDRYQTLFYTANGGIAEVRRRLCEWEALWARNEATVPHKAAVRSNTAVVMRQADKPVDKRNFDKSKIQCFKCRRYGPLRASVQLRQKTGGLR